MPSEKVFKQGMLVLCEQFEREATELLLKGYEMALSDMSDPDFEKAVMLILRDRKYAKLPRAAELREAVYGNPEETALIAVNKIEQAISEHGRGRSVIFDDPYIHAVITRLGGWPKVCEASDDPGEWKWYKKDVEKLYSAISQMNYTHLDIPLRLAGTHEIKNTAKGYEIKEGMPTCPIGMIGDLISVQSWRKQIGYDPL